MTSAARGSPAVLRHLNLTSFFRATPWRINHRRWAQVHDVRFLATTQESRSVLEKYRDKLDRKAREEGLPDIDALKKAYADKIESLRKTADKEDPLVAAGLQKPLSSPTTTTPDSQSSSPVGAAATTNKKSTTTTSGGSGTGGTTGIKALSAILDLPKARKLPPRELIAIWRLLHSTNPQSLCAAIPPGTYNVMAAAAASFPQFVLPVPHPDQGAELHFLQWTFDAPSKTSTVLFTQLAEYKARGEFAQPHTTLTHHLDLTEDKGLVLMQGQVMENRGVKVEDAQWLVMCLQRFYGGWDGVGGEIGKERAEERRRLLEWFGRGDERFTVEKLMEEAERMG
ncbi:ATP11 protein-domain-containing protein [Apodospora peruviana]|uniref:ATP11 protein-domain-containing protein n=1 Tax=Apodospora peruviana TaxID=516989 RepID=A0AAE0MEF1_9PEZI|nr:ATP11 protein-domain-containing protein [Apodospora peruviana]